MTQQGSTPPADEGGDLAPQQIRHEQLSARVPESVSRGVFSTGAIVLTGPTEFIVDFLVRMARPHQVAARVVMPHAAMPRFIAALKDNVRKFEDRFGAIPPLPKPPAGTRQPPIQEVYDDLKLPDDTLSGAYANGVMIAHSPSEFSFDFITNFFPRSAVSSRVFLSAPQVPRLLEVLTRVQEQWQQRMRQAQQQQQQQQDSPPPAAPPEDGAAPPATPTDESPAG